MRRDVHFITKHKLTLNTRVSMIMERLAVAFGYGMGKVHVDDVDLWTTCTVYP